MENKIREVFEAIYQEQLDRHRRGETINNLCNVIKTQCCLRGNPELWEEIRKWFKPDRYGVKILYSNMDNRGIPIEDIYYEHRNQYYWYPVLKIYNLKRLGILRMEIENQLKEEGYGEG